MPNTSLLLLLDGVLSQDEDRTNTAMSMIQDDFPSFQLGARNLLKCGIALERCVRHILENKPELARIPSDLDGSMPLHFAASIGSIPLARVIFNANQGAASKPNKKGKIPLHYAAREGRYEMVKFFMAVAPHTASIHSKKDKLALHFAASEGHRSVVQALLENHPEGASLQSKKGKVAIHFAARWGHVDIANDLLRVAPHSVRVADYDGSCPLHDAAREGQLEMIKFLVKKYPQGLMKENITGETPLFPAIRSGNIELARFMILSWPQSGKHVLQRVHETDQIQDWPSEILELCLRGAVGIWNETDEELEAKPVAATLEDHRETMSTAAVLTSFRAPASESASIVSQADDSSEATSTTSNTTSKAALHIMLPRSKSPILEELEQSCKRKQHFPQFQNAQKKAKISHSCPQKDLSEWKAISENQDFIELHAALRCGASAPVLNHILDRFGEQQLNAEDELGRLPLHVAMEAPTNPSLIDIILERIVKPSEQAAYQRDYLGRLPLHHALLNRADPRIIKALLKLNPRSGVEHTEMLDCRFLDKLPIEMAMHCGCDLSSIFMLLRGDPSFVTKFNK